MIINTKRIEDCTALSAEILEDFELSRIPIESIILKCLRLCRLYRDNTGIQLFTYESSGYPCTPTGLPPDVWQIAVIAGRTYLAADPANLAIQNYYHVPQLLVEFQSIIDTQSKQFSAAVDSSVPFAGTPYQTVEYQRNNQMERDAASSAVINAKRWYHAIKGRLYDYILRIHDTLRYGNIIEDNFTRFRMETNIKLNNLCPQAINKFISAYNNMDSDNPEDWANAVHTCRRIIIDLADVLYPPSDSPLIIGQKNIKVGKENYINRLVQFIVSKSGSETYADVVGADLSSIGNRLDAINDAVCKGTHTEITKDEASRYIIHTYLLLSDIVALTN